MTDASRQKGTDRNIRLYPWFRFAQNLLFWQAVWFLYFQNELSAAEAILLYAVYDVATTMLEVPSGYLSDRVGRRFTLIVSSVAGCAGCLLLASAEGFAGFALGQVLLGAGMAFASGTDTALLYESLEASGRADEVEAQEVRAWRFAFSGLAASAVSGGAMAWFGMSLPFLATAAALAGAVLIALAFTEPHGLRADVPQGAEILRVHSLADALTNPVLIWLFCLNVLMYGFSHLPFIFGQPFILAALDGMGLAAEAPVVSGAVTTSMMILSVIASLFAPGLRERLGLTGILLAAFALQIVLSGALALSDSIVVIAFLFLRMVPDSMSKPFVLARIQPLLNDDSRATYLSLQSLAARLLFAATLFLAALSATDAGQMPYSEIRAILSWFVAAGLAALVTLCLAARRVRIDLPRRATP